MALQFLKKVKSLKCYSNRLPSGYFLKYSQKSPQNIELRKTLRCKQKDYPRLSPQLPWSIQNSEKHLYQGFFAKIVIFRSSPPEVFLGKVVLIICSKYTGKHPCRSVISIKLQKKQNTKNTSGGLLLHLRGLENYKQESQRYWKLMNILFQNWLRSFLPNNICRRLFPVLLIQLFWCSESEMKNSKMKSLLNCLKPTNNNRDTYCSCKKTILMLTWFLFI